MPTPVISRGRWTPETAPSRQPQFVKLPEDSGGAQPQSASLARRLTGVSLVVTSVIGACAFLWSSISSLVTSPTAVPGVIADNRLPVIRVGEILPSPLTRESPVSLRLEVDDPDNDAVSFRYQWIINGRPVTDERGSTLDPTLLKSGDTVAAEVIPSDGKGQGPLHRIVGVVVVNTPPKVSQVSIQPDPLRAGEPVRVVAEVVDPDGDETRVLYRWWNSDVLVAESEVASLSHVSIARGDKIVVEVIPQDAEGPGKALKTDPVQVSNGLPRITSAPSAIISDGRYGYAISATDPDGDPLTYVLTVGPPSMRLDERSGQLEWTLRGEDKGIHHVRIEVRDGHNGTAYQEFDVTVPALPADAGA
ncbi:MAG: putative Ig domain-containing protein [Nitrospiraceae bacterium]